jgi:hypothetical protein
MNGGKSHMRSERADEVLLVRYLLGQLTEEEQVQVEDRAFADAGYLGLLEAAETDLIDSYVRGELSSSDRREFERRFFTSPQRREKVEFARALARVAAESKAAGLVLAKRPTARESLVALIRGWSFPLQFASGTAALLCVAGVSWLVIQNTSMRSRMAALEVQRRAVETREQSLRRQLQEEQDRAASLASQLQQKQVPEGARAPLLASLVLLAGLSRAETRVAQLALTASMQIARIEIQLEPRDDYPRFRAELRTRSGEEVLIRSNLPKRRADAGYAVSFDVPARALRTGEYELGLKGIANDRSSQDIGYYYFRVQKQ